MRRKVVTIWLLVSCLAGLATLIIILQRDSKTDLLEGTPRLDQLNMQTRDPQPAGRNIAPPVQAN